MATFAPKSGDGVRAACKRCGYGKLLLIILIFGN